MQRKNRIFFALAALLGLLLGITPYPGEVRAQGKITMAWLWTEGGTTDTYIKQLDSTKNLDVISPTGIYLVDDQGTLVNQIDNRLVQYAQQKGKKVWALFANQGFSKDNARGVLIDPAKRTKVVNQVVEMAVQNNYDGVNLDWEGLYTEDKDLYTEFVRELTAALKAKNKVVSVDVTLQTGDDPRVNSNWALSLDRAALGKIVDYVILMAYDEHSQANPNGSVASLPWVESGIKYLINKVPASKVILAVPFYTRDVSDEYPQKSQYIGLDEAQKRLTQSQASVYWDDKLGQNVATYYQNGFQHKIWVEDDKSLGLRLDLVNKYNLAGMSAWSLGSEFSTTWEMISQKMGKVQNPNPNPDSGNTAGNVYIVQAGDTLWKIAQKHGTTVEAIAKVNNLDPYNYLWVGQKLGIPGAKAPVPTLTPAPQPTPAPAPTPKPKEENQSGNVYVVQAGDSFWKIAQKQGTTTDAIIRANNLDPNKYLWVGQKLVIPGQNSTPPAQPAAYTVQPGDSLWKIAQKYGTTIDNLAKLNQIGPSDPIYVGQKLKISA